MVEGLRSNARTSCRNGQTGITIMLTLCTLHMKSSLTIVIHICGGRRLLYLLGWPGLCVPVSDLKEWKSRTQSTTNGSASFLGRVSDDMLANCWTRDHPGPRGEAGSMKHVGVRKNSATESRFFKPGEKCVFLCWGTVSWGLRRVKIVEVPSEKLWISLYPANSGEE